MSVLSFGLSKEERAARDQERGYSVDMKRVVMAYGIEMLVIAASLLGAVYFAHTYSHGSNDKFWVMLLAPIGYAVIEFCRVPLAISVRTQRSILIKLAALVGLVCAAMVTVKSMSQLGYLMFQPRLEDVSEAQRGLTKAQATQRDFDTRYQQAKTLFEQRKDVLAQAEARVRDANASLSSLPQAQKVTNTVRTKDGRRLTTTRLVSDNRVDALKTSLSQAQKDRETVAGEFEVAQKDLRSFDRKTVDQAVVDAEQTKREALFHSQLHTFTAMALGKDPDQVTEGELHWFLRIFVFIPAICVSFASTMLAFTSIEKLRRKPENAIMPDDAGSYLLGPLAQAVVEEASKVVEKTAQDVLRDAQKAAAKGAADAKKPLYAVGE